MSYVPNWMSQPSSASASNSSPKSPMVDDQYGKERRSQGSHEIPWEEERRTHVPILAYENGEIFSWINNYNFDEDVTFQPDLHAYQPYNAQLCSSPGPPLLTPSTDPDDVPSNSGCFSAEPPSATLTTIPKLPQDDKRKATELLGDDQKEYPQMEEEGNPSTKRQRSAATHNLSERRRRDRINVQMTNLQELIPMSNKLDKASVLQGTCEYVKSLRVQLQMFSLICEIHQTMGIGFAGRFQMAGFYMCPTNSSNIPGMLEHNDLRSRSHKTALARLCKQYLNLYETQFPRAGRPKMLQFADPQYQAQMANLAQLCQQYLCFYKAETKHAQDLQALPPIIQNKFTGGF